MEKYTFGQVSIPTEADLDEFSNIKSKPNRLSTNIISRIYRGAKILVVLNCYTVMI